MNKNQQLISILFFITCIIALVYKMIKLRRAKKKINELIVSNERLQKSYDNIRSFRHDFNNIMQAMGGYIAIKDINGLEKMYKSVVKECQEIKCCQSITGITITNPAIFNLINNKYEIATKLKIKMEVEVLIDLNNLKINNLDLCRILGILIDNAIEATKDCDEKIISIKFIYDRLNNRDLIIIENPCKNYLIDVNKIYEKGFTSKKEKINHGLGLWKVKQIIRRNKNLQIYTARDKLFKQQIEIYN